MKITKVNIPESKTTIDGLKDIKMDKISSVVVLAGKNGSGKTRILNKISRYLKEMPDKNGIQNSKNNSNFYKQQILESGEILKNLEEMAASTTDKKTKDDLFNSISRQKMAVQEATFNYRQEMYTSNWSFLETDYYVANFNCINFVPFNSSLNNPSLASLDQLLRSNREAKMPGMNNISQNALAVIQIVQNRWFSATHQLSTATNEEKTSANDDYEKLKNIINIFLNTDIDRNLDGEATLFGLPIGKANLSHGQTILLQFCVAIYSQEAELKDLILILDEPENHLHPSVIIEIIDRIQEVVTNGQIWIATHSIPLLAHFDPSLIWYVENGSISYAGKTPEKVLKSLLGDENEISKLQDFISLPAQYATNMYATQCLIRPEAVTTNLDDPQPLQIRNELLGINSSDKLKVLDFGAGKGRLIANLFELDKSSEKKLLHNIDYIAYDEYNNDKVECETSISQAYGSSENRYYNDFTNLIAKHNKENFDVVIMCNVLHEIDPKDWLNLFKKDGTIPQLLKNDGTLLIIEDHRMPIGEKAYQKGFLVLDTPSLKDLFEVKGEDDSISVNEIRDGRLKAHKIPKEVLIRINVQSRKNALQMTKETAKREILKIRTKTGDYSNGKLHGYWTQQFANAELSLSELAD